MTTNKTVIPKKNQVKEEKMDKYLTDIKELPPSSKEDESGKDIPVSKKPEPRFSTEGMSDSKPENPISSAKQQTAIRTNGERTNVAKTQSEKISDGKNESASFFTFKDIILGVINVISIALIIFLLVKLPQKASEFQTERIEQIKNQVNPQSEFGNIKDDIQKSKKLEALFLDESGIVRFVGDVEKLKVDNGAISKVTFASPNAVKDDLGLMGIPVTIELRGNWDTFGPALEKIQGLPYLFRPISVNAGPSKDDPSVLVLDYGVFLYVNSDAKVNN